MKVTVPDAAGLGDMEEILDGFGGDQKFAGIVDAAGGFYQFLIHPRDRHKTAFVLPTSMGGTTFQWLVAPYGLSRNRRGRLLRRLGRLHQSTSTSTLAATAATPPPRPPPPPSAVLQRAAFAAAGFAAAAVPLPLATSRLRACRSATWTVAASIHPRSASPWPRSGDVRSLVGYPSASSCWRRCSNELAYFALVHFQLLVLSYPFDMGLPQDKGFPIPRRGGKDNYIIIIQYRN